MLGGSLFYLKGSFSEAREGGVERECSSQELGNPFFVFVHCWRNLRPLWNRMLSLSLGALYPTWEENEKYKPGRERRGA